MASGGLPSLPYDYVGVQGQITGDGLPATVRELTAANVNYLILSQDVSIRRVLRLTSGSLFRSGRNLTLLSGPSGTALVAVTNGTLAPSPSGQCRMQRYIDPSRNAGPGYRHFSSPMLTMPVSGLATAGFVPVLTAAYNTSVTPNLVTPFPTVFGYNQGRLGTVTSSYADFDKGWYVPSATDALVAGRGLTVHLPASAMVTFTGTFNNQPTLPVALGRGPQADAGWHLLGNPYPAPFDLDAAGAITTQNVGAAAYVFESTGPYAGQYRPLVNGIGSGPQVLAAGQGFFVRTAVAGQPSQFQFNQAGRVTTFGVQPTFRRGAADTRPQLELALAVGNGPADVAYLYAEAGATAGVDAAFDACKILNPGNASVYALAATGEALAVQGIAAFTAGTTVPLALMLPTVGAASFTVALHHLPVGLTAYLVDAATGARQDLTAQPTYSFTAPAGDVRGRFAVVFGPAGIALAAAGAQAPALSLYPNPAHQTATLTLAAAATARSVQVLDALGRTVRLLALSAHATELTLSVVELPAGVYVVRCGAATARLVVE